MVPADLQSFFVTSAGVAGVLIGLLFVTISVSASRIAATSGQGQVHRIRAGAALTSFSNSMVVSLFALIPGHRIGPTALAAGTSGLIFVVASLLSLVGLLGPQPRPRALVREFVRAMVGALEGRGSITDLFFLVGLAVVFAVEAAQGFDLLAHPGDAVSVENLAILVIACFLIGIPRSWELIGGPSFGIRQQVASMVRRAENESGDPDGPPAN